MKKLIALALAMLMLLSMLPTALAAEYKDKATVKDVQQALNDAGYDCGKPDGAAGKKTKAAITAYQTDKGLEVTGVIDDALLESLGIEIDAPEAEDAGTADSAEEAGTGDDAATSQIDWDNPANVASMFNRYTIQAFKTLGVDVQSDNIGEPYMLTKVEPVGGVRAGWRLLNEDNSVDIHWGYNETPDMIFSLHRNAEDESGVGEGQMTFSDTAVTAAALMVMGSYFGNKAEIADLANALLDAAPDRDGIADISLDDYNVSGDGFELMSIVDDKGVYINISTRG